MKIFIGLLVLLSLPLIAQEPPATTPEPTANTAAKSSIGIREGKLIHKVAPVYPPKAKAMHLEGPVTLSATITKEGKLRDIKIVSGDPEFSQAALDAVSQWGYEPYRLNNEPVEVQTSIKINFVLPPPPPLYERSDSSPGPAEYNGVPHRIRVSQAVAESLITKKATPKYPVEARFDHIQGSVVFAVLLDYDGKVKTLRLVSGHPLLVAAALDAVKQWEYKPYFVNGASIQVESQITINFTLSP